MEYIYAAMLLHKAKQPINEENVKKVLTAVGMTVDDSKVKTLVVALDGVDIDKAIKEAVAKAVVAVPAEAGKKEEKSEEDKAKEEKVSEEKAAAGLGALFG